MTVPASPSLSAEQRSPLRAVLWEMRPALVSVLVFSFVVNLLMLAPSLYMLQVYDRVLGSRNITTLVMLSLILLLAYGAMATLDWTRSRILIRVGVRFDHALGARLLAASHRLGMEKNGGSDKQLLTDLTQLRQFLSGQGIFSALDAPWVPIYLIVITLLNPTLGLAALVGGCVLVGLAVLTEVATERPLARANERAGEAMRFVATNMRNREVIEAMGMLGAMTVRWQKRQDEHLGEQALASERAAHIGAVSRFIRVAHQSAMLGLGAWLVVDNKISPGVMIAASILTGRLLGPVEMLIGGWRQWGNAIDAWKRIDGVLAGEKLRKAGIALPPPRGEVRLEGVSASAPGVEIPYLRDITITIPAGSSVAVVGASASGKSSLARIIAGVWPPRAGNVRLDGADLDQWPREALGPHIGYLPQDVELFEGTVAENIARHTTPDSAKVIAAAQAAGLHEAILRLPQGYDTQVGSSGAYLSGGQRQRVALARALHGNPTLLVLDEPNANLDEAGEMALDIALRRAKERQQTVILVSHRPNALRNCDLMLVMQEGRIAVFGPREQVLAVVKQAAQQASQRPSPTPTPAGAGLAVA